VLERWSFSQPGACSFHIEQLGKTGSDIPDRIKQICSNDLWVPEDFEALILAAAQNNDSMGKVLKELKEPRPNGETCIPWLGETELKERIIRLCAKGKIAINVRGTKLLQASPGESDDAAWKWMVASLGYSGRQLDEVHLLMPSASPTTGGAMPGGGATAPEDPDGGGTAVGGGSLTGIIPGGLWGGSVGQPGVPPSTQQPAAKPRLSRTKEKTSALNHLAQLEMWGIKSATQVQEINLHVSAATGALDTLLCSTAWELWNDFPFCMESTSASLIAWWKATTSAKAVLVLDGLSLRELPWLLQGAEALGFAVKTAKATAAEIPAETSCFAKALGFQSRASLANNVAGASHFFPLAKTDCVGMPWKDAASLIDAAPFWFFWHEWPDVMLHQGDGPGQGLESFSKNCAASLSGEDFWTLVRRLAQGRSLVITSDHGYAASGLFNDAADEPAAFLKNNLKSGRSAPGDGDIGPFLPPIMMRHENSHGIHRLALGRWKWKSPGGYPTLTHGGMSLLELLVPWVELEETKRP